MAAHDAVAEAPPKQVETAAPADNLHKGNTAAPTAADVNAGNKPAQDAAQATVDNHFAGVTITNADQINLCQTLLQAPRDALSQKMNKTNGHGETFDWKDGVGHAFSAGADGKAAACILNSKTGTEISASGQYDPKVAKGELPMKPDDIQIVSGGGKIEYTPGPNGTTIAHETDRQGNKQDDRVPGTMKQNLDASANVKDLQYLWAPKKADGVDFMFSSSSDTPQQKQQLEQWKASSGYKPENK
jgi:hypothetical protein